MLTFRDPRVRVDRGRPAVFLDRDGVLVENLDDHVRSTGDVRVIPGAPEAVRRLAALGYLPIIVTNQAVIGRGGITEEQGRAVHDHVLRLFRDAGATFVASYLCPHAPADGCRCRKPRPGMLERGVESFGVDAGRSLMVGDAYTDVLAADAAGVASALVLTGRGTSQASLIPADHPVHNFVHADVSAVAESLARSLEPPRQ